MTSNFSFNSNIYDLWPTYEAIKKYYPIGINRGETGIYFEYSGIKELEKVLVENIHDPKNCQDRWRSFTKQMGEEMGKEIVGTTYGQDPIFSAFVIIVNAE